MPIRKDLEVKVDLQRAGRENFRHIEMTYRDENYLTVKNTLNAVPVTLTELGATTVSLVVKRQDKTEREVSGTITENGDALFILDGDSLEIPGAVEATAQYYDAAGDRISTAKFLFKALEDPSEGAVGQQSEQSTVQKVIGEGPGILAEAEQKIIEMDEAVETTKLNYKGYVENDAELAALTGMEPYDTWRIALSASNGNRSATARWDGTQWIITDVQDATIVNTLTAQLDDTLNKTAITLTNQFADNTARDAYFSANPSKLFDKLFIKVGTGYQQRINGVWESSSPVLPVAVNQIDDGTPSLTKTFSSTKINADFAKKTQDAWITPTLINGATGTLKYRLNQNRRVEFKGTVNFPSQGSVFTMPSGYRPSENSHFAGINSSSQLVSIRVLSGGLLQLYGTTGIDVHFAGVTYSID